MVIFSETYVYLLLRRSNLSCSEEDSLIPKDERTTLNSVEAHQRESQVSYRKGDGRRTDRGLSYHATNWCHETYAPDVAVWCNTSSADTP